MECVSCEGKGKVFAVESYPCSHCNEKLVMEYYMCEACGLVWRTIDGIVDQDSLFTEEDRGDFEADGMEQALSELMMRKDATRSMDECINRCLRCNSISYEVKKGSFKCSDSDCGFEWEVIECE